jgi:hypothetical protein
MHASTISLRLSSGVGSRLEVMASALLHVASPLLHFETASPVALAPLVEGVSE